MKFSVSTYSFSAWIRREKPDYPRLIEQVAKMGFEGIEFVDLDRGDMTADPAREAPRIRQWCADAGLPVVSYTVGGNFMCEDPEAEVKRLCGQVDIAAALGAPLMRHDVAYSLPRGMTWEEGVERMAPYIRRVAQYASDAGLRTMSENHGYIYQDPDRVERLIRTVDHPAYGWLVDIGNFLVTDCDPAKSVAIAAPYAFHVHAKDFVSRPGNGIVPVGFSYSRAGNLWRGTVLGHGVIPVVQCLSVLKRSGYDAYVSLEFEGPEEPITAIENGLTYLRRIRNALESG